jgi:hypothetical protein
MTASVTGLREAFTEFGDTTNYPDSFVEYWIGVGEILLPADRWSTMLDHGIYLYACHEMALEAHAVRTAANGGVPGQNLGILTNKSVDKVSMGYDASSAANKDAGHWNLTIYGNRFYRLMMMFGAGPIQVGSNGSNLDPLSSNNAWTGPDVYPGFTNFS